MLRGVIRALGVQGKCVYLNVFAFGVVNLSLQYLLVFVLQLGLSGLWTAKLCMELFVLASFAILIERQDW